MVWRVTVIGMPPKNKIKIGRESAVSPSWKRVSWKRQLEDRQLEENQLEEIQLSLPAVQSVYPAV
jgi:hypothetical protein